MSTRYTVTHRTAYAYDDVVTASYGLAYLLPRDVPGRQTTEARVVVEPAPADRSEHVDVYGNRALYFAVLTDHDRLVVTATSRVEVLANGALPDGPPWDAVPSAATSDDDAAVAVEFALPSPLIALSGAVHAFAAPSFTPGRPLVAAARDLMHRIHTEFEYVPGVTSVTTGLDEVLAHRSGVCQDFAHLLAGCLRSHGVATRYVSGYLATQPPPGQPRLQGADASHAWVGVHVPGYGWLDLDPTNDVVVDERYVVTAWGRDYGDVTPLKGVIFTESASSTLEVAVDVAPA